MQRMSLEQALDRLIILVERRFGQDWLLFDGRHWAMPVDAANSDYEPAIDPDQHPFTEIFLSVQGHCALSVEERQIRVAPGDAVILLPGTVHCEMPRKNSRHVGIWITLAEDRCVLHLSGKNEREGFYTIAGRAFHPDAFSVLFSYTRRELAADHAHHATLIKGYLLQMLIHARRELQQDEGQTEDQWAQSVAADIRRYVAAHLAQPIRLEDLSRAVCLSANHLGTLFKKTTGLTVTQYVTQIKMEKAKQLLLTTDASIKEIADRLGFYDSYHFSKTFKKATQVSPSRFRKT